MIFKLWLFSRLLIFCEDLSGGGQNGDSACILKEYSTQCRDAGIDQVFVPTVKEMVWEFSLWVPKQGLYLFYTTLFLHHSAAILKLHSAMFKKKMLKCVICFCLHWSLHLS